MLDKPSSHTVTTTNSDGLIKEQMTTSLTKHLVTFKRFVERMPSAHSTLLNLCTCFMLF